MNKEKLIKHLEKHATIELIRHDEETPLRGNVIASGDDEVDRKAEQEIVTQLNSGNDWAWCCVEVKASYDSWAASDYLGGCSYDSEASFKTGGYFEDMKQQAIEQLADKIITAKKSIETIEA